MTASRYFVRHDDVPAYHPANHTGTSNRRLIGADNVGARQVEMVHGTIVPGQGALPHAHPGIEQVCYLLEGEAHVEVAGEKFEMAPGDACFFPADAKHLFIATTPKVKVMVIYAPPYGEDPKKVIR